MTEEANELSGDGGGGGGGGDERHERYLEWNRRG